MKKFFKILLIFLSVVFSTCTKNLTESESFSLTGKVTLEGQADHSGITVALYPLVELDTAIVNMQKRFPTVGIPISQATEFDHRLSEPVYQAKTDKDGNYILYNIPQDEYNLVVEKKGFGWHYLYNVTNSTKPENIKLLPEIEVQGSLGEYTVWNENQHFVIIDDITVPENATLVIEPGVVARFNGYFKLTVLGNLIVSGSETAMVNFTHNRVVNFSTSNAELWEKINIQGINSSGQINYAIFTFFENGLKCDIGFLNIKYSKFKQVNKSNISNSKTCLFLEKEANSNIENNIIESNYLGILAGSKSNGEIKNNFFYIKRDYFIDKELIKNAKSIYCNLAYQVISDNIFMNIGNCAISSCYASNTIISNNYFQNCYNSIDVYNFMELNDFCSIVNNTFVSTVMKCIKSWEGIININNNNFFNTNNNPILTLVGFPLYNIDAKNNYWEVFSVDEIQRRILDDRKDYEIENNDKDVIVEPFSKARYLNSYPR